MHGWSGGTPGDPTSVEIYISNPDPTVHTYLFVSVFFGVANFVGDIAMALAGRDTRWPLLTSPPFTMAAGTIVSQTFTYLVPPGIPSSTYLGNGVLWKANHLDQGVYFDRNLFNVAVR
jgi:hypothetical protein